MRTRPLFLVAAAICLSLPGCGDRARLEARPFSGALAVRVGGERLVGMAPLRSEGGSVVLEGLRMRAPQGIEVGVFLVDLVRTRGQEVGDEVALTPDVEAAVVRIPGTKVSGERRWQPVLRIKAVSPGTYDLPDLVADTEGGEFVLPVDYTVTASA